MKSLASNSSARPTASSTSSTTTPVRNVNVLTLNKTESRTMRQHKCDQCGQSNAAAKKISLDDVVQLLCNHCYLALKQQPGVRVNVDNSAVAMQRARRELSKGGGLGLVDSPPPPALPAASVVVVASPIRRSPSSSTPSASSSAASSTTVTGALAHPTLYHVKGLREPFLTRVVAPIANSMNSGDAFVLHTAALLMVWHGALASKGERVRSIYLALELQASVASQTNGGAKPDIVVIDEAQTPAEFWHALGGSNVIRSAAAGGDDKELRFSHALYGVKEHKFVEVLRGALPDRSLLQSGGVFVLESDDGVSVWCGRNAPPAYRTQAFAIAEQLTSKHALAAPSVELDGHESVRFRTQVIGFDSSARLSEAKKLLNSGKLAWRVNTLHVQPARIVEQSTTASYADGVISSTAPRREALQSALVAKLAATQLNIVDNGDEDDEPSGSGASGGNVAVDNGDVDDTLIRLDSLDAFDLRYRYSARVIGGRVFGAVSGRGEVVLDATAVCAERLTFGALTTFLEAKSKGLLQVVGSDGVVKTMTVVELTSQLRQ